MTNYPTSRAWTAMLAILAAGVVHASDDSAPRPMPVAEELARLELRGVSPSAETFRRLDEIEGRVEDPGLRLELWRFRAECRRKAGEFAAALAGYRAVLDSPDVTTFLRLLVLNAVAETLWSASDLDGAERAFATLRSTVASVAREPGDRYLDRLLDWLPVAAAHHHAAILAGRRRTEEAIAAYDDAIRINTPPCAEAVRRGFTNARAAINVAVLCETEGQRERAVAYLQRAKDSDAVFCRAYVEHRMLEATGLKRGSSDLIQALDALLKRFPQDPWTTVIRLELFHQLKEQGEGALSRRYLDEIVEGAPVHPDEYGGLVRLAEVEAHVSFIDRLISEARYLDAEAAVRTVLERYPETPQAQRTRESVVPYLADLRRVGESENRAPDSVAAPASVTPGRRRRYDIIFAAVAGFSALVALSRRVGRARRGAALRGVRP